MEKDSIEFGYDISFSQELLFTALTEKTFEEHDSKKIPIVMGSGKDDSLPIGSKDGEFLEDGRII